MSNNSLKFNVNFYPQLILILQESLGLVRLKNIRRKNLTDLNVLHDIFKRNTIINLTTLYALHNVEGKEQILFGITLTDKSFTKIPDT